MSCYRIKDSNINEGYLNQFINNKVDLKLIYYQKIDLFLKSLLLYIKYP